VTTLAGAARISGKKDGLGADARLNHPLGLTVDPNGTVYVADSGNYLVRAISPAGNVTTVLRDYPVGALASDAVGNIFVSGGGVVLKMTGNGSASVVAGSSSESGRADGPANLARFSTIRGLAVSSSGEPFVTDTGNNAIRKISSARNVSTIAGPVSYGNMDGPVSTALFRGPTAMTLDNTGTVYLADTGNQAIRKIRRAGVVSTVKVIPELVTAPSPGLAVGIDSAVYYSVPSMIRKLSNGVLTTFAGSTTKGSADGVGASAQFAEARGVAFDQAGNLYVADLALDAANNLYLTQPGADTIRKVTPQGAVSTIGGAAFQGCGGSDGVGDLGTLLRLSRYCSRSRRAHFCCGSR
jgi:NHL repeat